MKITQDVREYAAKHGLDGDSAIEEGMKEMSETFKEKGAEVYLEPDNLKK
jgi:phosphomethylpyrimidine synthase